MKVSVSLSKRAGYKQLELKFPQTANLKFLPLPEKQDNTNISTNGSIPLSEERNQPSSRTDKSQVCQFKIRPCNGKKVNKTTSIDSKHNGNFLVVNGREQNKISQKTEYDTMVVKQFTASKSPIDKDSSQNQKKELIENICQTTPMAAFHQIDLFKPIERVEVQFASYNMQTVLPLAHRPVFKQNEFYQAESPTFSKYTVIVSLKLLNLEAKKYFNGRKGASFKLLPAESPFGIETTNMLKNLSGRQGPKSFLNRCNLYYKVSSRGELELLEHFLQDNGLYGYAGIINVQDDFSERFNLYTLRGIIPKDDPCIFLEDEQALKHEIPMLEEVKTAFFIPITSNYYAVSQLIDAVKSIKWTQEVMSPAKSPMKKKISLLSDSFEESAAKENMSPNKYHRPLMTKRTSEKRSPTKRQPKMIEKVTIAANLRFKPFIFDSHQLISQVRCCLNNQELKKISRSARSSRKQVTSDTLIGLIGPKCIRERSLNKRDLLQALDSTTNLEGPFKEKLVAFVKIIQAEKRLKPEPKRQGQMLRHSSREAKEQDKELQQMTACLVSRDRCRTSYQMVGQLLRNNARIAKQVGQYLNTMNPCTQAFRKIQKESKDVLLEEEMNCNFSIYSCQ